MMIRAEQLSKLYLAVFFIYIETVDVLVIMLHNH